MVIAFCTGDGKKVRIYERDAVCNHGNRDDVKGRVLGPSSNNATDTCNPFFSFLFFISRPGCEESYYCLFFPRKNPEGRECAGKRK